MTNKLRLSEGEVKVRFSIVIPCYDEAKNIPLILQQFARAIKNDDIEVIMVDNGSTDCTPDILSRLLEKYTFAKSIRVDVNQGYGYGIQQGLKACKGDFVGWTHADMQTDPADVIKAFQIIRKNGYKENIFVKGNRKGRPFFDQFFTIGMSIFEMIYLGEKLKDINGQPNIFHRKFYNRWLSPPNDFAFDLYVYYMACKYDLEIHRFPVLFPERIYGKSKWNNDGFRSKFKFIKRTIEFSVKLKKKGIV